MKRYVLDTNIVSYLLRRDQNIVARFQTTIMDDDVLLGCPMVWYEIRRGLIAKDARSQMRRFMNLFKTFNWSDFTVEDWDVAAQLWAKKQATGSQISDADLLIGIFTLRRNAILVTANENDFMGLNLNIDNWSSPIP